MIENPIYNPTPNTGVKGANPGINTAKYQAFKASKGIINLLGLGVKAVLELGRDVVKGIFKSS